MSAGTSLDVEMMTSLLVAATVATDVNRTGNMREYIMNNVKYVTLQKH